MSKAFSSHWRFKTPDIARESAAAIYKLFGTYLTDDEFVGADMARKFLQMGYTRARRYANYKGGKTYDAAKAESAAIFYEFWKKAEAEPRYAQRKKEWKERTG